MRSEISKRGLRLSLAAAAALALVGCSKDTSGKTPSDPPAQATDTQEQALPVTAATARRGTLRPVLELLGTLEAIPERVARVDAPSSGWIASFSVVPGDHVGAGAELLRFDTRRRELTVAAARARQDEREAALLLLRNGPLPGEIGAAEAAAEEARARLASAHAELEAARPLAERGELSEVTLTRLDLARRAAEATVAARESELGLLRAGTRAEDIARGAAELATARSELAAAELELSFCTVTSPIAGTVGALGVRRGEFVDAGAQLVEIEDQTRLFVRFRVPASHRALVRPGTALHLSAGSGDGSPQSCETVRLGSAADPSTGEVEAFALLENPAGAWLPGLAVAITVDLPPVEDALIVPAAAVADRLGTPVVTVVRDGRAHEVEVSLGVRTAEGVQITAGLREGEQVVTEGGYGLPDGLPVELRSSPRG